MREICGIDTVASRACWRRGLPGTKGCCDSAKLPLLSGFEAPDTFRLWCAAVIESWPTMSRYKVWHAERSPPCIWLKNKALRAFVVKLRATSHRRKRRPIPHRIEDRVTTTPALLLSPRTPFLVLRLPPLFPRTTRVDMTKGPDPLPSPAFPCLPLFLPAKRSFFLSPALPDKRPDPLQDPSSRPSLQDPQKKKACSSRLSKRPDPLPSRHSGEGE
jgi:hypothetical protein